MAGCAAEVRIDLLDPEQGELPALRDEPPGYDGGLGDPILYDDIAEPSAAPGPIEPPSEEPETPVGEPVASTTAALALRYDFEGEGTLVQDKAGSAHGTAYGGSRLDGSGVLELDGRDDYVDLPNGVISTHESVTVMAWLHWYGGACWQRIFDFGNSDSGEGFSRNATTSLFLTPASCPEGVMTSMTEWWREQFLLFARRAFPTDRMRQVVLVVDTENDERRLYVDGELEATGPAGHPISSLDDVNNWLGRSQWIQDRYLRARFEELRIYDGVLQADEVADLYERGPDQP